MNKLILYLLFSLTSLIVSSQKVYFVYIQSESDQPFFIKMNGKINSSTGSGYLILPKLLDTSYNLSIGFPQNKWPEQNFSIPVNKKDHGYLLKNFGEKGWGLFDLQTLAVQMPAAGITKTETTIKTEAKNVSAFTDILSKAADDPSLKEKPVQPKIEEKKSEAISQEVVKKEESKVEIKETVPAKPVEVTEKPVAKTEQQVTTKPVVVEQPVVKKEEPKSEIKQAVIEKPVETTDKPVVKKEEPKVEIKEPVVTKPVEILVQPIVKGEVKAILVEEYKKSIVVKKSESSTTEGFGLVFLDDQQNGIKDTIRLLIPNPKPAVSVVKEEQKEEKKFLDIATEVSKSEEKKPQTATPQVITKDEPKVEIKEPVTAKPVTGEAIAIKSAIKNNCSDIADESDFFKLRKKMAAIDSDDEMINEAKKNFKVKCFTVQQVKNLGALFLNDAGKYKFFDAAYTFVADVENFSSLQNELKDEYYINRFKAMLRN